MKVKFLGTGGACDPIYRNSAAYIQWRGKNVLIDCGHTVFPTLVKTGLVDKIDLVLITHLHDDHVGSLSTFFLYRHFHTPGNKPKLLYVKDFFKSIHDMLVCSMIKPGKYVDFEPLSKYNGITVVDTFGLHVPDYQTYGYILQELDKVVAYSGDLADPNKLFNHLDEQQLKDVTVFHDISFEKENKAHAYYKDVAKHLDRYNIYGYHCDPEKNQKDNEISLVYNEDELLVMK